MIVYNLLMFYACTYTDVQLDTAMIQTSSICDYGFGYEEARVLCRSAGNVSG